MPHIARLEAVVDELVVVWSPSLYVRSRGELVTAIFDHDDAITEIGVEIVGEAIGGPMIYIEWQVKGRFVNPGFLDDDLLIEPSHSQIETAGVLVYAFAANGFVESGASTTASRCSNRSCPRRPDVAVILDLGTAHDPAGQRNFTVGMRARARDVDGHAEWRAALAEDDQGVNRPKWVR